MLVPSVPNESLAIVAGMMNDRSGLWGITADRVSVIRDKLQILSVRSRPVAMEMITIADRGDKFWPTKAEYYVVLSEIKVSEASLNKAKVDAAIAAITTGARLDNVADKAWVKQALDVLSRVSREKQH